MTPYWKQVFRRGIVPQLSTAALEALRLALVEDDARLIQGQTTDPPNWMGLPVERACAICYGLWQGDGHEDTLDLEAGFQRVLFRADCAMQQPECCREFIVWFDDTPRDEMRRELLPEVNAALAARHVQDAAGLERDETIEALAGGYA